MSFKKFKAFPDIAALRLEAIFHPKFENENPDSEIRSRMLARVAAGEGYLEASLKHSGSLLLWSGRRRFYSKNSTDNVVSRAGEIVLMRHFARCFGAGWREEYDRCSAFVSENRITCSFEVVTSVLGHHGALPERDYLILIAAADRGGSRAGRARGRFYSTNELVRFAHEFRLPHNDAWMFSSSAACESLFQSYDDLRETGTAARVIKELNRIVSDDDDAGRGGCSKVASLYPHDIFQGDILEGIVVRFVPCADSSDDGNAVAGGCDARRDSLREMDSLCARSNEILRMVPPSPTLDQNSTTPVENLDIGAVDLRALAAMNDFEQQVENVLRRFHGSNFRKIQRWADPSCDGDTANAAICINIVEIAERILSLSSAEPVLYDQETLDIAQLVQTIDYLKIAVSYKVLTEETPEGGARILCILHIHHDSSFPKYNAYLKRAKTGGMMLFRGFSFELVPSNDDDCDANNCETTTEENGSLGGDELNHADEEKLMLKMKFLPYMVRTFICRNGLSILQGSGVAAFEKYAVSQLSKWHVSDAAVRKFMPFFRGWAKYCSSPPNSSLPPPSGQMYLHHYNEYHELFANGEYQTSPLGGSSFYGLIVVVGINKNDIEALSLGISQELSCSKIVRDVNQITDADVVMSMQRSGGGLLCIAKIEEGFGHLRRLFKENNHEALQIILVGSGLEDMPVANDNRLKRIKGMTNGWRNMKCNMLLDLPKDAANQKDMDTALEYLRTNDTAKAILAKLEASSENNRPNDERPGLIVYFPSLPGSGKSSLCQNITANSLGIGDKRKFVLMGGDQTKGKFFTAVQKEILAKPASVAILDKNVPPSSFASVHALCIESKSIALPILPLGMKDTLVGDGASSHIYPFSLQYLATCISRVLRRRPNTHQGKLDSATENACMIVVKFYCFYRNRSVSALKEKLQSIGYRGEDVIVPFFREKTLPDLPADLKTALEDAITAQTHEDMNIIKIGESVVDLEEKLRSSIHFNQTYIDNLTVSLEESKSVFLRELSRVISSLPEKLESNTLEMEPKAGTIKIASLDLNYEEVHSEIEKLRKSSPEVEEYFANREHDKGNDENDKSKNRFVSSVHCTFAHASQATQANMISTFQHLLGTSVKAKVISILFSDDIAAIELEMLNSPSIPRPENVFPHVTIWCAKDSEACESNDLPEKVKCNGAKKVVFEQPVVVEGVLSFWYY